MKRRAGEGSVHQRPNGSWCAQVNLGPGWNGTRRRKTIYGRSEDDVTRKLRALLHQLDTNGDLPTSDIQLGRWLDDWLVRIAQPRVKPSAYRSYRVAVTQYIKPTIGSIRLGRLSVAHVRKMHAEILTMPSRRGGTISTTTAHNAHRALSAALADAVREGRVGRNVASLVPAPTKADNDRVGLSASAAMTLLRRTPDARWLTALLLGTRQGERLGLRWDHVDLDAGIVDLSWSLTRANYTHGCTPACDRKRPYLCPDRKLTVPAGMRHEPLTGSHMLVAPKTRGSRRVVPMPDIVTRALRAQHDLTGGSRFGLVWCHDDGTPLDAKADWRDWQAALTAADLPRVTLHEARHTTASLLLELGVDVKVISAILGHSTVTMTRSYQHASVELSRAALTGLAERLELTT